MENFAPVLIGSVIPGVVAFIEKYLLKKGVEVPTGWVLGAIFLVLGMGYTLYAWLTPGVVKEQVAVFASSSIGTAVLLYELYLKHGLDSE
jgi:hypothetical protein